MSMPTDIPTIPFGTFGRQLDTLVIAMGNKIDREWPVRRYTHPGGRALVLGLMKVSENSYRTIRYFAADEPPEPARKLEYALNISPLARTVLDALFSVVFLFGKLDERVELYYKSGWREVYEEHERLNATYGGDPDWATWLAEHKAFVQTIRSHFGISDAEAAAPRRIPYWPTPSQMIAQSSADADRRAYLQYLNDWFYRALSQETHLSWPGLARRGAPLLPGRELEEWKLRKSKSDGVIATITLLLALVTELELELRFELRERIQYVWGIITPFNGSAEELYRRFYRDLLAGARGA